MKVLLISGSPAAGSHTSALLKAIANELSAQGDSIELWDLGEKPLPLSQPSWHANPMSSGAEAVCNFYGSVMQADAIVLGTPLYHGSYSGVLKNALDCLTGDAFANKPVGLVSHGSNARKSHQPCLHLTTVAMTMEGIPMLTQIGTDKSDYDELEQGYVLVSEDIKARCKKLAQELQLWANRISQ